ncbi:MAG: HD domain-containing protein [Epulopiscium sp.]|nr:HD domain-containing protein [Candidatus Epulonipiscium sp.]
MRIKITDQMVKALQTNRVYLSLSPQDRGYIYDLWSSIEEKDVDVQGHMFRVGGYAKGLAEFARMDLKIQDSIQLAGFLHDIGKKWVPDQILFKSASLSQEEFNIMRQHPIIAKIILKSIELPENIITAIECHHRQFDLQGYPCDRKMKELPLEAAVIGIADAFDAMTTSRPYRSCLPMMTVRQEIEIHAGTQFHPTLAKTFLAML